MCGPTATQHFLNARPDPRPCVKSVTPNPIYLGIRSKGKELLQNLIGVTDLWQERAEHDGCFEASGFGLVQDI
jgi:hypothetical protein